MECAVCAHPAKRAIESRITSGEPLSSILRDFPIALFYHKVVCMQGHRWTEFQRPGVSHNSDRWPLSLDNGWLIKVAELYSYDYLNDTRLGITAFHKCPDTVPIETEKIIHQLSPGRYYQYALKSLQFEQYPSDPNPASGVCILCLHVSQYRSYWAIPSQD